MAGTCYAKAETALRYSRRVGLLLEAELEANLLPHLPYTIHILIQTQTHTLYTFSHNQSRFTSPSPNKKPAHANIFTHVYCTLYSIHLLGKFTKRSIQDIRKCKIRIVRNFDINKEELRSYQGKPEIVSSKTNFSNTVFIDSQSIDQ